MNDKDQKLLWEAYTTTTIVQEGIDFEQFKHKLRIANPKALKTAIMDKIGDATPLIDGLVTGFTATMVGSAIGNEARKLYEFLIGNMPEDDFLQWLSEFLK